MDASRSAGFSSGSLEDRLRAQGKIALVMAIVNCNGDSFFAPSRALAEKAVDKSLQAEADGADIIDLGGESTRPGAAYVSEAEELERVLPVVEGIRRRSPVTLSIDTRKAAVAKAALEAGANIINDISALEDDPAMGSVCAARNAAVILMHKKGVPDTMQDAPFYADVVAEVASYLRSAARRAMDAGIAKNSIILDPGIGFGKRLQDNIALVRDLAKVRALGYPILMALSRKTFIGEITGRPVPERLAGTLAANALSIQNGAQIIRAHDVKETVDLVKIMYAIGGKDKE
jgi:dihydropteroate synthase